MGTRGSLAFVMGAVMLMAASLGAQGTTRIAPKDKLTIKVVSGVELGATEFSVDGEGAIDFPYLGKVKVAGLTPSASAVSSTLSPSTSRITNTSRKVVGKAEIASSINLRTCTLASSTSGEVPVLDPRISFSR